MTVEVLVGLRSALGVGSGSGRKSGLGLVVVRVQLELEFEEEVRLEVVFGRWLGLGSAAGSGGRVGFAVRFRVVLGLWEGSANVVLTDEESKSR